MFANQNSSLETEMEHVRSFMKLTPEERKEETRRQMFEELRAIEMERRERAMEERKKERKEREQLEERVRNQREMYLEEKKIQEAKKRAEEERKANEIKALQKIEEEELKQERLRWKKAVQVEEKEPTRAQREKQQERQEKTGPCRLLKLGDKTHPDLLTSDLKTPQEPKKTLINNWVGKPETDREAAKEKPDPLNSTHSLLTAQAAPKTEKKSDKQASKPKVPKTWMRDFVDVHFWMNIYQAQKEKKDMKREKKAAEQYARWSDYKASQASHVSRQNSSYTEGFAANRNSILKSLF